VLATSVGAHGDPAYRDLCPSAFSR
jgi:hypothetical protein